MQLAFNTCECGGESIAGLIMPKHRQLAAPVEVSFTASTDCSQDDSQHIENDQLEMKITMIGSL